jgi:hypothetical protein
MKTCPLALCVFVSVLVTSSLAEEDRDGNWWRTRRQSTKAVYVTGMIDGLSVGTAILTKNLLTQGNSKGDATAVDSLNAGTKRLLGGVKVDNLSMEWIDSIRILEIAALLRGRFLHRGHAGFRRDR